MKLVTLIENTTSRSDLRCEHGLSLYIETKTHRILFDAGQSDGFAENAATLGIDLSQVDLAILSHGHYDHSGGLLRFLELNQTAPIYLQRSALLPHWNAENKDIGVSPALQSCNRLIFAGDQLELADGITLCTCNNRYRPYETNSFGLQVQEHGQSHLDEFYHEQYLLIQEANRTICVSGCSHKGILNIVDWFHPDILIGGFHFMKLDPARDAIQLEEAAQRLLASPTTYYTGHCTGTASYDILKRTLGDRLHCLTTGAEWIL